MVADDPKRVEVPWTFVNSRITKADFDRLNTNLEELISLLAEQVALLRPKRAATRPQF